MSEYLHTPSQAEGERDEADDRNGHRLTPAEHRGPDTPWTTPSQAEGERDDDEEESTGTVG